MLTDEERVAFDAECKAICARGAEYEKKPSVDKLWDVRRALSEISYRCAVEAADLAMAGDEAGAGKVGSTSSSISYLGEILEGVVTGRVPAPVAIESLQRELRSADAPNRRSV